MIVAILLLNVKDSQSVTYSYLTVSETCEFRYTRTLAESKDVTSLI
jgi:hypothetical protein